MASVLLRAGMRSLVAAALTAPVQPASPASAAEAGVRIERTNNRSPWFPVNEGDVGFFMNYTGFTYTNAEHTAGRRFFVGAIEPEVLRIVGAAEQRIVLSVFLFDNFYARDPPERDIVGELTEALVHRRTDVPDIRIAVILDPSHKAYGRRESPAERRFRENGIDVFYSDLLSGLKRATFTGVREGLGHVNRGIDVVTFGGWGALWTGLFSQAKIPKQFDGDTMSLETVYNALLMKANHRKLLVADDHGTNLVAMVSSANPHNASASHVNSAVTVRGDPARYVYNVLRADMEHSASLGGRYAHWHDDATRGYRRAFFSERFPELPVAEPAAVQPAVRAAILTESAIPELVTGWLNGVETGDAVRLQMFYLSFEPVVDALVEASTRTDVPLRLLLDANKDSFNREKDGTPNRQVARHLLAEAARRGGRIEIRWYSTHGEQNHAKTLSIVNPRTGKRLLTTGSCNWTGRNMDGVNMEANIAVDGAEGVTADFNALFDRFWTNADGNEYSLPYDALSDETAPDRKWRLGEKPFYYSRF